MIVCQNCGNNNTPESQFCRFCGARMVIRQAVKEFQPPRPYAWKTDEYQTQAEARATADHVMTPLQRSSTPDDIARAVRFLLESPAITGTTLLVDGGQHLTGQPRDVLYLAKKD